MADDVEITAGSGTIIKTDQVGTDHVQFVKLMDGTLDGAGVIAGSAAKGLDVDVTRVAKNILTTHATDTGVIAASLAAVTAGDRLVRVSLHFSSATTPAENFTVTLDANDGAAYDTVLAKIDVSASGLTDYVYMPDGDFFLEAGDAIDLAFANTSCVTYGVQIVLETSST